MEDLSVLLLRRPCPLLRLHVTGGQVFEISDPDLVVLTRTTIEVLLPQESEQLQEAVINLLHVVWIEVVELPTIL